MGTHQYTFHDKYEEYMQNFLCRLLRHDFVVSYINEFFNKNERTYYSFFMLMKVLGAHKNLKFQTNYWSDCYIYFYEKLGIHGILFIPLLLSKGTTDDKKKILKKYLNEHINNTKERITATSNLVINLLEFKKVILTYISCVSTRGLENVIKAMDNDPEEQQFLARPGITEEIKDFRTYFSNHFVESFVDVLLRPYSRQNYYVNAGKFIDDNIDFLTDDKSIRLRLYDFSYRQAAISKRFRAENDILRNNEAFEVNNRLKQIENKNDGEEPLKLIDEENKDISDIGGNKEKNNKNSSYINNNINNNQMIINTKAVEQNDISKSKNNIDNKRFLYNSSSSNFNLNEPLKLNESSNKINNISNKIGKENKNIINEPKKIYKNESNISFKMADFEVKEENIVRPLEMKANNNINNNINNRINNNSKSNVNNDFISDFEESFKEENIPKNID